MDVLNYFDFAQTSSEGIEDEGVRLRVRVRISVERQENRSEYALSLFCIIRKISTFCDVDICPCRHFAYRHFSVDVLIVDILLSTFRHIIE